MTGRSITPISVDTDNALGAQARLWQKHFGGDVDDAFAISFLLAQNQKSPGLISEILSVGGNTSAHQAFLNNQALLDIGRHKISLRQGLDPGSAKHLDFLPTQQSRYLALGPLTNLNQFLKNSYQATEVWMTLGYHKTKARHPPYWPMEFNATEDYDACVETFRQLCCPITITPLDVAKKLKITPPHFAKLIHSKQGTYLQKHARRWQFRNRLLKFTTSFSVWDLVSACAIIHPQYFQFQEAEAHLFKNGLILYGSSDISTSFMKSLVLKKQVRIITDFHPEDIWQEFFSALLPALA